MADHRLEAVPSSLYRWITLLAEAVPARSVPTFLELLIGAMITRQGFVTEAILAICARRRWQAYYHWIARGRWSWLALARRLCHLLTAEFKQDPWHLVLDDTLVPRTSRKAPDAGFHFDHCRKPNRAPFLWGQGWITLAAITAGPGITTAAIPLLSRLVRQEGRGSKLIAARTLLRAIRGQFGQARLLLDCWYMRASVIHHALDGGLTVIGQVRKDVALFGKPSGQRRRGRPRKYGERITATEIEALPETVSALFIYGELKIVRFRSAVVLARFLGGRPVRVVWTVFETHGKRSKPRLLLSTDPSLTAKAIIQAYALRWKIEPLFHALKNGWGVKDTWQRTRQVLHRWVHILCLAQALPQLLALRGDEAVRHIALIAPWRRMTQPTAGLIQRTLAGSFAKVEVAGLWDRKRRIFRPPDLSPTPSGMASQAIAA